MTVRFVPENADDRIGARCQDAGHHDVGRGGIHNVKVADGEETAAATDQRRDRMALVVRRDERGESCCSCCGGGG